MWTLYDHINKNYKRMKTNTLYFLISASLLFLLNACKEAELPDFSGEQSITFIEIKDTLTTYTFFYDDAELTEHTVYFDLQASGYTSDQPREILFKQVVLEGVDNAEPNVHYEAFSKNPAAYVVQGGSTRAKIGVKLFRDALVGQQKVTLLFEVAENEHFQPLDPKNTWRKLVFTSGLIRPNSWTEHTSKYYYGEYSVNKHRWMIEQTGKKWDDAFITAVYQAGQATKYWRDLLNLKLEEYNKTVGPLYDDKGVEILGFPK